MSHVSTEIDRWVKARMDLVQRCETHGYEHAKQVQDMARQYTAHLDLCERYQLILDVAALGHDVGDGKFADAAESQIAFEAFIAARLSADAEMIIRIIDNISWSKEAGKGDVPKVRSHEEWLEIFSGDAILVQIRHAVSDADKNLAIGKVGNDRTVIHNAKRQVGTPDRDALITAVEWIHWHKHYRLDQWIHTPQGKADALVRIEELKVEFAKWRAKVTAMTPSAFATYFATLIRGHAPL